jgi:lauroyl/myristoyl acyltransferase
MSQEVLAETSPPDQAGETISERLSYAGFAAAERAAMALPEFVGRRVFDAIALAAFHLAPGARGVVAGNLATVLGRKASSPIVQAATKEAFRSYARYWYDTFHIRAMPRDEFHRRCRLEGRQNLERALEGGRGAVLALPHLGNWDVAGAHVAGSGMPVTAVAELLRPERVFRLFLEHRRQLGMRIVPLYDDRKVGEELVRLIGENVLIALVADRDLKGRGVLVEMFGRQRRIPAGPALLSLYTGSPLMPASCYDVEDGWVIRIAEPLEIERTGSMRDDVTTLTRLLAAHFERSISAAPTQWHMFQPAWPDGGDARASAVAGAGLAGEAAPSA